MHAHKRRTRTGGAQYALVGLRSARLRINGKNGRRASTYHHRDESTAIERACLSEIIGPANAGLPDPLRRLCLMIDTL